MVAGCNGVPPGYRRVEARVEPDGRAIAVVPFAPGRGSSAQLTDGIKLAEFTARKLQSALPDLKVLGPGGMQDILRGKMHEGRWSDIGQEAEVELLVVGEITSLETRYDKLIQAREGGIGLRFRVLDVSAFPPEPLKEMNWYFNFPDDSEKFEPRYVLMDDATFRNEVLKYGAGWVAGVFYDHFEKRRARSQLEVRWHKE